MSPRLADRDGKVLIIDDEDKVLGSITDSGTSTFGGSGSELEVIKALGLKAWTSDPAICQGGSQKNSAYLHGHITSYITAGTVITSLGMFVGGVGSSVTHARMGIYSLAFAKLAESADTPSMVNTATGWRELSLTSPWTCPTSGCYYFVELIAASTMPTILGNFSDIRGSAAPTGSWTQAGRGVLPGGIHQWWFDSNVAGGGTGYTSGAMPATAVPDASGSSSDHCIIAR